MSKHGYRKIKSFIPLTNAVRETNTFAVFAPPQYIMPQVPTPKEFLLEALANLSTAVQSIGLNTTDAQERERMKDGLKRLQDVIKNKTDMVGGEITELTRQRVPTREPMYDRPLTAVNHHHNTRQNARLNNIESTCVAFNPNSIAQLKCLKRDPWRRVTFVHRLVKNEWPRPPYKNEHLLFHSQDDKYNARDAKSTCREYRQYKLEECQSFIDCEHAKLR